MYCLLICGSLAAPSLVTLWQPMDRFCCSGCPQGVASKCSSVSSILATQAHGSQRGSTRTATQLVMHLFTNLADAAIIRLAEDPPEGGASIASSVVPGSSAKQRYGSTTQSQDVSAEDDSRFPPPEPTCLPQRSHGKPECTLRLVPDFDDCRVDHASAESDAFGRSQSPSPAILSPAHHQHAAQHQCVPFVSNVRATAATVSTDESFVDCVAITTTNTGN